MSEVANPETPSGPSYALGSVNVDSVKEILNTLGSTYPWQDEATKNAFHEQVATIDSAGDPHAEPAEDEAAEASADAAKDAKIAELEAQLAAAQASQAPPAQ